MVCVCARAYTTFIAGVSVRPHVLRPIDEAVNISSLLSGWLIFTHHIHALVIVHSYGTPLCRYDNKTAQYHSTIKQGDLLLNRVQKLSRVINI